jgi:tRNA dimethylallyltransferase
MGEGARAGATTSDRHFADCWFLTGPTACGKSSIALALADRLPIEIVGMDSMTLYRGMNIGTDMPSTADHARTPHHLFEVLEPHESATVHWYLQEARRICDEIRQRGRTPMFVGGTPLYLKTLLRGLFEGPAADEALRTELELQADRIGVEALHRQLAEIDPPSSNRIKSRDRRRIIRAIEVHRLTGIPLSHWQREFDRPADPPPKVACTLRPRDELYRRINERAPRMFDAGWEMEVSRLMERDQPLARGPAQAVGIQEIQRLMAGELTKETAIDLIQTRTRQFCKRQMTWFRGLQELVFFHTTECEPFTHLVDRLEQFFSPGINQPCP